MKKIKNLFKLSLVEKRSLSGYLFTLPLTIGFILFFLYPLIQSILFSLSQLKITADGYELIYQGVENYRYALLVDPDFNRVFIETIGKTISDVPLILGFSFFAAILLNKKFKGRALARIIFFLPVILGAGVVLKLEQSDYITNLLNAGGPQLDNLFFGEAAMENFLLSLKFPEAFLEYIIMAVDYIPDIVKSSGIQILIFLAGLQSIPGSLYEAADVEGTTGWEKFWLITLPLMSPLILVNIVYTIIASFTSIDNRLLSYIQTTSFGGVGYGVGTAMAWVYFILIMIILAVLFAIFSSKVFYQE